MSVLQDKDTQNGNKNMGLRTEDRIFIAQVITELFYITLLVRENQSLEAKRRQQTHKLQFSFFLRYITSWISELSLLLYCYLSERCHHSQTAFRSPSSTAEFSDTHLPVQCIQIRNGTQPNPVTQVTM